MSKKTYYCRLCATEINGAHVYLFSPENTKLARELNECLPITVKETDSLPKQLCSECVTSFEGFQNFFYQVLRAEQELNKVMCKAAIIDKRGTPCVSCPLCPCGSMGVKNGRIILGAKNDTEIPLGLVDQECITSMITNELGLQAAAKGVATPNIDTVYQYLCFKCQKGFMSKKEISNHMCNDSQSETECKPTKESSVPCEMCGKLYKNSSSLRTHISVAHPKVLHTCTICKDTFRTKTLLEDHIREHIGETPFECPVCGQKFSSQIKLRGHLNTQHAENGLRCSHCQMVGFPTKQALDNHVRTKHTKERSLVCEYCDKAFMSSGVYYQHRAIHKQARPYKCEHCNQGFERSHTLANHMRTHTGERPFRCNVCGKAFKQRGDMKKHEMTQHLISYLTSDTLADDLGLD